MQNSSSSRVSRGPLELQMRAKVETVLKPIFYAVVNESHQHSVPENSETHFKLLVVSDVFENMSRLARSRFVHEMLSVELQTGVHALTQKTWTPAEYEAAGNVIELESPACRGGSRTLK